MPHYLLCEILLLIEEPHDLGEQKMVLIEEKFRDIMNVLGLDLNDDSLNGTPHRVAKMFVKEIFSGLNPENQPKISVFENKFKYEFSNGFENIKNK